MRKKNYIKWLQLFGLILFVIILIRLDFQNIINQLAQFKWSWLGAYAAGLILMLLFKALRWRTTLSKQGINYSIKKVFAINTITSFWGLITPGKVGELAKVTFLQKDDYSFTRSLVSIFIDRLYDVIILILLGVFALTYFISIISSDFSIIIIFFGLILAVVIFFYFFKEGLWELIKKLVRFFIPLEKYNTLTKEWNIFKFDFGKVFPSTIFPMLFYSFLAYLCYYVQIYVVALGFGINISFFYLGLCSSLAALISLVPISIGGLGTREAVFLYLLSKVSISSETAVLIPFIEGSVFAIICMGLLALGCHFFLEIKINRNVEIK